MSWDKCPKCSDDKPVTLALCHMCRDERCEHFTGRILGAAMHDNEPTGNGQWAKPEYKRTLRANARLATFVKREK